MNHKFFIFSLLILFFCSMLLPLFAHAAEIVVQIPIPNVSFPCTDDGHIGKACVESLGDYIGGMYRFLAGAIGVIAALMVMFGGFKWATAAGNTSRVSDAKDVIYSAIIALLLVFGSYILLFTINPQLVKLQLPDISSISRIPLSSLYCSDSLLADVDLSQVKCDPTQGEKGCCGESVPIKNTKSSCRWDLCPNALDVCRTKSENPFALIAQYDCVSAATYCEEEEVFPDKKYCQRIDQDLQRARKYTGFPPSYVEKFKSTGCGYDEALRLLSVTPIGPENECRWNKLLSTFTSSDFTLLEYEKYFVDCFTPGAEGVCWVMDDKGNKNPNLCSGGSLSRTYATFCRNPGDFPRPVAQADGGCLVKTGKFGSGDSSDYLCWDVPPKDDDYLEVNP